MKLVSKLWGLEKWLVNNELYCAKILRVASGFQCSLHRHLVKDETFVVEAGSIYLEVGDQTKFLTPGDTVRIPPLMWHRFANHEEFPAEILEVSTHHEDADVERKEESRKI